LKSAALLGDKADTAARVKLEAEMGPEAKLVRANLNGALRAAMTLQIR
jgi:hypothetical protein